MNNNLRFPISDLAQELYDKMVIFAKFSNDSRERQEGEFTFINESNKYDFINEHYQKYLPKEFKIIKNGIELLFEGLIQKHCVNSYVSNINRGECCILTTEYNEKRYTAEIHFGTSWLSPNTEHTYRVNQFKGYANTSPPKALQNKLQDIIDEVNKKEKKYISKKEGLNTSLYEHTPQIQYIDNLF
jgi:hypothetical protein